ncbi:hypothetical protein TKK_0009991 [Trichogramma kaykai]
MNDTDPEVLKIICDLHKNLRFTRSDIDDIISTFSSLISYHNKLMFSQLESVLKNSNDVILHDISKVFDRYKNPFESVRTCDVRENLLKKLKIYTPPIEVPIDKETIYKTNGTKVTQIDKPVKIVHVPLENSLTSLLQVDGLFEVTIECMDYLNDINVLTNFIQGNLWKKNSKRAKKDNKLVLPLSFYSDDAELGNPLGSHAGVNKVGANYLFLLCLPPNIASKLFSIILCDLYYAKYRKLYGNKKVFEYSINELNKLRDKGIRIETKSGVHQVHFITSIITGDNLGLNGMLRFIESFNNTIFCRICYSLPILISKLTKEDSKLLRTVEKYENDVKSIDTSKSGIKEPCVFNALTDFHNINSYGHSLTALEIRDLDECATKEEICTALCHQLGKPCPRCREIPAEGVRGHADRRHRPARRTRGQSAQAWPPESRMGQLPRSRARRGLAVLPLLGVRPRRCALRRSRPIEALLSVWAGRTPSQDLQERTGVPALPGSGCQWPPHHQS